MNSAMLHIPRLLIVAGTGRKTGKTTTACNIINAFSMSNITAVKISSHFHEPQEHLKLIFGSDSFIIWEELDSDSEKDSSRFLAAGATRSFYIQALKQNSVEAFTKLLDLLSYTSPIVCESPSLARGIIPGVLIVVSGEGVPGSVEKEMQWIKGRRALHLTTVEAVKGIKLPVVLNEAGFSIYPPISLNHITTES
ncbi:MAG: hypothetical protein IH591_16440 [Bacteroidales bacterium]|nr:hypothetical protein [Bacteroidales bacterium]